MNKKYYLRSKKIIVDNNGEYWTIQELEEAIKKVQDFEPKPYIENNKKMLEMIENFIDNIK